MRSKNLPVFGGRGLYICVTHVDIPCLDISVAAGAPPKLSPFVLRAERLACAKLLRAVNPCQMHETEECIQMLFCGQWLLVESCTKPGQGTQVVAEVAMTYFQRRFRETIKTCNGREVALLDMGSRCDNLLLIVLERAGVDAWGVGTDCYPHAVQIAGRSVTRFGRQGVRVVSVAFEDGTA